MSVMALDATDLSAFSWASRRDRTVDVRRTPTQALWYASKALASRPVNDRIELLTEAQRDCLRLVFGHMTSKDIARALGVSPHTVDMRLRTAMRTLGVASRIDAARALVDAEGGVEAYQSLVYQAPEIAGAANSAKLASPASTTSDEYATQHSDPRFSPDFDPPAGGPPRSAGASLPFSDATRIAMGRQGERGHLAPLAGSLPWGTRNTLSPGARLAWIAGIAMGSALSFGAIIGALAALTRLL